MPWSCPPPPFPALIIFLLLYFYAVISSKTNDFTRLEALKTRLWKHYVKRHPEEHRLREILVLKNNDTLVKEANSRLMDSLVDSLALTQTWMELWVWVGVIPNEECLFWWVRLSEFWQRKFLGVRVRGGSSGESFRESEFERVQSSKYISLVSSRSFPDLCSWHKHGAVLYILQ